MSRLAASMTDQQAFERAVRSFPHQYRTHEVFRDFCEVASASFANAGAPQDDAWRAREDRYLAIVRKYGDDFGRFPELLGVLVEALQNSCDASGAMQDVLGLTFERLELSNHFAGQYFTPMSACEMMAEMTLSDVDALLADKPFITVLEPASGCGRTLLAIANVLRRRGFDPAERLRVTAVDVDPLCVAMTHITMTLAAVPAAIIHGNSLTLEQWGSVTTPMARTGFRFAATMLRTLDAVAAAVAESSVEPANETGQPDPGHADAGPTPKPDAAVPRQLTLF